MKTTASLNTEIHHEAELVIIGAGYAGLNALVTANKYLKPGQHAIIADVRSDFGGQWNDTYSYVRLHQPHQLFTVCDKPWDLNRGYEWYLATGAEVLEHLQETGREEMKQHGTETLFEHRYVSHHVHDDEVHVKFEDIKKGNALVTVKTRRLIHACQLSHPKIQPLKLSSTNVRSITPNSLPDIIKQCKSKSKGNADAGRRCHFVTVGSGKSALDTIAYINAELPEAKHSIVAGNGMAFLTRDNYLPKTRTGRYFGGETLFNMLADAVLAWDGTNEKAVLKDLLNSGRMVSTVEDPYACYLAIVSLEEQKNIDRVLDGNIVKGRMSDIVDDEDDDMSGTPKIVMQDGTRRCIPGLELTSNNVEMIGEKEEIFVINCTARLFEDNPPQPLVSGNGMVLCTQIGLILPGPTATMMTHMWFLGKLSQETQNRFYRVHLQPHGQEKQQFFFKASLAMLNNMTVMMDVLPFSVLMNDRTSPIKWFPMFRQVMCMARMKLLKKSLAEKCDHMLGPEMKYTALVAKYM